MRWAAILLLSLFLLPGCGSDAAKPGNLVPASGTINLDGAPLNDGIIALVPQGGGPAITANIKAGNFTLDYSRSASGMPPGTYQVSIRSTVGAATMDAEGNPVEPESRVAERFGDPAQSGLLVTVPEGGTDALILDVSSE
ncbi:MAG: hypothetical protein ACE37I_06060 [Rubinisphaera brasiliensis]|uniref:hypothetical protein n=1 Tax=Rubinisphaera brasiliensis TaxID=119 RepID=UPI000C64A10F|nr:hypothetical protein [Planctomyces sp.]MBR9801326.1 hypothetical protein [bacterium]